MREMSFSEKLGGFVDSIRRETLEHQRGFVQMARSIAASDGLEGAESSQISIGAPETSQLAHHGGSQPS